VGKPSFEMATRGEARKALERALAKLGSPTQAAYRCGVSEGTIRYWKRRGHLNGVPVETVLRLSRASGVSLEDFVIEE
jgi:transposase